MSKVIMVLFVLVSLGACKSKKDMNGDSGSTNTPDGDPKKDKTPTLVMDPEFFPPKDNPAVTISKATMDGSMLTLEVEYSGGCEDHAFELMSKGAWKKSMPPQVDLFLKHENNGDACRQLVMQTIQFDVSAAKYPGGSASEVILLVTDGNSDPVKVSYKH